MSTKTKVKAEPLKPRPGRPPSRTMVDIAAAIWAACTARPEVVAPPPEKKPPPRRPKGAAPIDFHAVPAHQVEIDDRLRNWGTWCNSRQAASSSPMFRLAPPTINTRREQQSRGANTLDRSDAIRIAQAVTALPESHAASLNWYYVKPVSPRRAAENIGVSLDGLAALVIDARQMLVNRLY